MEGLQVPHRITRSIALVALALTATACFNEEHAVEVHHQFAPRVDLKKASSIAIAPWPGPLGREMATQLQNAMPPLRVVNSNDVARALNESDLMALSPQYVARLSQRLDADVLMYGRIMDLDVSPSYTCSEQQMGVLQGVGINVYTTYERRMNLTLKVRIKLVDRRSGAELADLTIDASSSEPAGTARRLGGPRAHAAIEQLFSDVDPGPMIHSGLERIAQQVKAHTQPTPFDGAVVLFSDKKEKHAKSALAAARRNAWEDAVEMYEQVDRHSSGISLEVRARAHYNLSVALTFADRLEEARTALASAKENASTRRLVELIQEQDTRLAECSGTQTHTRPRG